MNRSEKFQWVKRPKFRCRCRRWFGFPVDCPKRSVSAVYNYYYYTMLILHLHRPNCMGSVCESIKSIQFTNTSVISAQIKFKSSALSKLAALGSSWYVPDKYKTKMVEIQVEKCRNQNGQTGGGAKSSFKAQPGGGTTFMVHLPHSIPRSAFPILGHIYFSGKHKQIFILAYIHISWLDKLRCFTWWSSA